MAPKYQMVADSLRTDILDGVYQKRMLLPTEQLCASSFRSAARPCGRPWPCWSRRG